MIRRTLALAGAAVVLAGANGVGTAAAAHDGTTQQVPDVMIIEVGALLSNAGPGSNIDGSFAVFENLDTSNSVPLNGFELRACNSTSSTPTVLVAYGTGDVIGVGGSGNQPFYLTAGDNYAGPAEDASFASSGFLERNDGAIFLVEATTGDLVHGVGWGTPASNCVTGLSLDEAGSGITPTSDESIHRISATSWANSDPTPRNSTVIKP